MAATGNSTRAATGNSTRAATGNSTRAATGNSTRAATGNITRAATDNRTREATRNRKGALRELPSLRCDLFYDKTGFKSTSMSESDQVIRHTKKTRLRTVVRACNVTGFFRNRLTNWSSLSSLS